MPLRITPSVAEQEGQQTETEATGAPQKHHYTLNQQVGSITDVARYIREHGNKTVISPEWSLIYFSLCQCELHQSHEAIIFHNGRPAGLFILNETGELTELYLLGSLSDILTAAAVNK
ncbi:hypothetical protein [Klebsiella pneumoniae]|uniref:hypothetical protein n=3 Tax=Klebsiella TaxID=570 RepID=UPI00295E8F46|nr:hypothetical protein [Klebsiella pneumoniae]WOU97138.1 hypothetical protein R5O52_29180 [Klebsiella pneumoniae]